LLYFFVWRDVKVRYKQTAIGALWAILQPVALTLVFTLFLSGLRGISPEGIPYALFALSGLVPWTLFSQTLTRASESLVLSATLLQKVYFPRLLLPISAVGTPLLDFGFGLAVLAAVMLLMGLPPSLAVIWLVPLTALAVGAALASGIWLSALNVRYRDVRYVVPFLVQIWFFATPIIYTAALVPDGLRWLFYLNPMAVVIDALRWGFTQTPAPPPEAWILGSSVATLLFIVGYVYFRRHEPTFADYL
jgi:lipopolysaccharide transport system permease protein